MTGKYLDGVRLHYPFSLVGLIHLCILCEVADVKIQCLIDKRSVNHIIHIIFSETSQELSDINGSPTVNTRILYNPDPQTGCNRCSRYGVVKCRMTLDKPPAIQLSYATLGTRKNEEQHYSDM